MSSTCVSCGVKLSLGRRFSGHGQCEACEQREAQERSEQQRQHEQAQREYASTLDRALTDTAAVEALAPLAAQAGLSLARQAEMKMAAIAHLASRYIEDESLSAEEETALGATADRLGLTIDHVVQAFKPFGSRLQIAKWNAGRVDPWPDQPSIILKAGEIDYLEVAAQLMKEVVHRETRGGYSGFSIPITKGVRFRTGSYRGRSVVVGTTIETADSGVLCVTSQRAVFKGMRQALEFQLSKLIGVNVFDDGIQFQVSNRKTVSLFRVGDGHLVAAAVNVAVQRV